MHNIYDYILMYKEKKQINISAHILFVHLMLGF
jgi:hypothetical protein